MLNSTYTGVISFIVGLGALVLALLHVISFDVAISIVSVLGLGTASIAHSNTMAILKK